MNIKLKKVTIEEITEGYSDNTQQGVIGYNGKLNIRPAYQREFIYKGKQRDEVIRSVRNGFPLNVMYWAKTGDDTYEVLDGQQRTISICQYVSNDFSVDDLYFDNLTPEEREQILSYPLMVYECSGTDREKLNWFQVVNIAGEKLYKQEIRNAVFSGSWVTDARRYFSKTGGPATAVGKNYIDGKADRQDYLETALNWISIRDNISIEDYMAKHQHDKTCADLWAYFQAVIAWAKTIFPKYRKELKKVNWGLLYKENKDKPLDPIALEEKVSELMLDDDITRKPGIYPYLFNNNESELNIRAFTQIMKRSAYERQKGFCAKCGEHFTLEEMEADHITPWSKGGKTIAENCQMLCKACNRIKSNK